MGDIMYDDISAAFPRKRRRTWPPTSSVRIPAMPVVDEHGTLLGIVTTDAWTPSKTSSGDKTKATAVIAGLFASPSCSFTCFAATGGLAASRRPALLGGCHEREGHATAAGRLGAEESAAPGSRGDRRYGHSRRRADRPRRDKKPSKLLLVLAAMGPGVVTAMAGNDAGGISTYSTAGANFGFGTLWVIPIMCVLLAVVETTAGRMGAVTGKASPRSSASASASASPPSPCWRFWWQRGHDVLRIRRHRLGHGDVRRVEGISFPWRPWACGCSWWAAPAKGVQRCSSGCRWCFSPMWWRRSSRNRTGASAA